MVSITIGKSLQIAGSYSTVTGQIVAANGLLTQISNEIANTSGNEVMAVAFDKTKVQAVYAISNVDTNIIFRRSGPANEVSIALAANNPYIWTNDTYFANPFGNNIADVDWKNTNANNAACQLFVLIDPT